MRNVVEYSIDDMFETKEDLKLIIRETLNDFNPSNYIICCIGTDKVLYDAVGPLIGTMLINGGCSIPVIGDLDKPMHAQNLEDKLKYITDKYSDKKIIAVDAVVVPYVMNEDLQYIIVENSSIKPGRGADKFLPPVGDIAIKCPTVYHHYTLPPSLLGQQNFRIVYTHAKLVSDALFDLFSKEVCS